MLLEGQATVLKGLNKYNTATEFTYKPLSCFAEFKSTTLSERLRFARLI